MPFDRRWSSLGKERLGALLSFQKKLGISFRDISLLDVALVHSSFSNKRNNERMEFVGDAVLGLIASDELYSRLKIENEGVLTRVKAVVICEETLAKIGFGLELEKYICLGKGEEKTGGRRKAQ